MEPFIISFKTMNKILENCFSSSDGQNLRELETTVRYLGNVLKDTGVSESLKMHVILQHLLECVHYLKGGLGLWSEQAGESVHREFLLVWNKYKLNSLSNPLYEHSLFKAVVEFSSNRL